MCGHSGGIYLGAAPDTECIYMGFCDGGCQRLVDCNLRNISAAKVSKGKEFFEETGSDRLDLDCHDSTDDLFPQRKGLAHLVPGYVWHILSDTI